MVSDYTNVPALVIRGNTILHPYKIASETSGNGTAMRKLAIEAPSMLQLRHGYHESEIIRDRFSPKCEKCGEVVRAAIGPPKKIPDMPGIPKGHIAVSYVNVDGFYCVNDIWKPDGINKQKIIPPSGWQGAKGKILYDEDGMPVMTYRERNDAIESIMDAGIACDRKAAEDLASYFERRGEYIQFAVVHVEHSTRRGPFSVHAVFSPDRCEEWIGVRKVYSETVDSYKREHEAQVINLTRGFKRINTDSRVNIRRSGLGKALANKPPRKRFWRHTDL
jgi:hypothetical protein